MYQTFRIHITRITCLSVIGLSLGTRSHYPEMLLFCLLQYNECLFPTDLNSRAYLKVTEMWCYETETSSIRQHLKKSEYVIIVGIENIVCPLSTVRKQAPNVGEILAMDSFRLMEPCSLLWLHNCPKHFFLTTCKYSVTGIQPLVLWYFKASYKLSLIFYQTTNHCFIASSAW